MEIQLLDDIMTYYGYIYASYPIVFSIICFNLLKAIYIRKNKSYDNSISKIILISDLIVDVLCGIIMAGGMFLQGVLADYNAPGIKTLMSGLTIMSFISLIIFILNIAIVLKKKKQ